MKKELTLWHAFAYLILCLTAGFVGAMATYWLMLGDARHLPGGSLAAGMFTGFTVMRRYKLSSAGAALMVVFGYAFIGVTGWLIALPFMH